MATDTGRQERAGNRSVRIYEELLRLYPSELRDRYGDEMARCFRDLCRDALRDGGRPGLAVLWARTMTELPRTAIKERLAMLDRNVYRSIAAVAIMTGLILLIPLAAMLITGDVDWSPLDFAAAGILLFGTGFVFVLAARRARDFKHVATIAIVLAATLVYVWLELAVGVFTSLGS